MIRRAKKVESLFLFKKKLFVFFFSNFEKLTNFFRKNLRSVKKSGSVTSSSTGQEGVLENFVDAVVISNRRGVITFFNAAAENTFGWSREDVIGKNVTVLMPQSIGKVHKNFIRRYRKLVIIFFFFWW